MKKLLYSILISTLLAACSTEHEMAGCAQLQVTDAWVREAPPGVKVLAAYMHLENNTSKPITVVTAQSNSLARVEFHQSINDDGVMKMQPLPVLEVPANSRLKLEPGGRHMMLFDPNRDYRAGDQLEIQLDCSSQDSKHIALQVKRVKGTASDHQHHHH